MKTVKEYLNTKHRTLNPVLCICFRGMTFYNSIIVINNDNEGIRNDIIAFNNGFSGVYNEIIFVCNGIMDNLINIIALNNGRRMSYNGTSAILNTIPDSLNDNLASPEMSDGQIAKENRSGLKKS